MKMKDFYCFDSQGNISRSDGVPLKPVTFQQMCELISKEEILTKKDGTNPSWEEIYSYSPTGDLFMIFEWYYQALAWSVMKHELKREDPK